MLKIFIDADGCPVKEETYKVAFRYQLSVSVVANKPLTVPLHKSVQMHVVSQGPDEADNWIVDHIEEDDICITSDIPLADRCLKKSARVLGVRGEEFTENTIGEALASRDLMKQLRDLGMLEGGPDPFNHKDRSRFLDSLDRVIQSIIRQQKK